VLKHRLTIIAEMFGKVDKELGERIAKQIEAQDDKHVKNTHDVKQ
jgi:hypothetical protein